VTTFTKDTVYAVIDFETRSCANLKRTGSFEYAADKSTELICVAYRIGTRETLKTAPIRCWSPLVHDFDNLMWRTFITTLLDTSVILCAHNALFEQVITKFVVARRLLGDHRLLEAATASPSRWLCTASLAAALALPRALEGAAKAAGLPVQKDMEGRKLLLQMCKPRKATKKNTDKWHESPPQIQRLMEYCKKDVEVETDLFLALPPLHPTERKVWELDQRINLRGFQVDRKLAITVLDMIDEETRQLNKETDEMTLGMLVSTTQRDGVLEWLAAERVFLPNLQAKTVADALAAGVVDGDARRMLEIRQAIGKTSTAKYEAFEHRSRYDGRLRDNLLYHGASTGRWGGAGVQPHNFPRGDVKDSAQLASIIALGDLELVRFIYGNPLSAFASCLRGVIVAPKGRQLYSGDYSTIEVRVLFWLAKHLDGLQSLAMGEPIYEDMAAVIYGKNRDDVTKEQRQVGKAAVLGAGFQLGAKKFREHCQVKQGIDMDENTAELAIKAYRSHHYPVVQLWANLQRAAIAAIENRGKRYAINRTTWWLERRFLFCQLPSGRRLAYADPEVRYEIPRWGGEEKRPVIYHYETNPVTRQWERSATYGGKLTANVTQATARDLMAAAMLRIDAHGGYDVILTVHDEIVAEADASYGTLAEFEGLMKELPSWAAGLPVKVDSYQATRYRK